MRFAKVLLCLAGLRFTCGFKLTLEYYSSSDCTGDAFASDESGSNNWCWYNAGVSSPYNSFKFDCNNDEEITVKGYDSSSTCSTDSTTIATISSGDCQENVGSTSFRAYCEQDDDPCFARDTFACRTTAPTTPEVAYAQCFGTDLGEADELFTTQQAERVLMTELRAGDEILSSEEGGKLALARVVVNQHVQFAGKSHLLKVHHSGGALTLTPDHVLEVDGDLAPASSIVPGSNLGDFTVTRLSTSRGGIINPLTANGRILAAGEGLPVAATTGNQWIADLMLSTYPQYTLSFFLAAHFPARVQAYYDCALEPFFNANAPRLRWLKARLDPKAAPRRLPTPAVAAAFFLADAIQALGFFVFLLFDLKVVFTLGALVAVVVCVERAQSHVIRGVTCGWAHKAGHMRAEPAI